MKSLFTFYFGLCRRLIKIPSMKRNLDTPDCRSRKLKPVQNMANSSNGNTLQNMTTDSPDNKEIVILEAPIKSENDKKDYRVIRLKNGLTVLLIADLHNGVASPREESMTEPEEDAMSVDGTDSVDGEEAESDGESASSEAGGSKSRKTTENETLSAASLTIRVGSFQDPEEIPGLAHFLEHMVFMGSEKYPQENDFDSFIKKQGGHDNAATDWDVTTFYFVSQERHFHIALDKFAQFFISPLMKKDAMQREREAIESEFKLALPSDYHRKKQLLGSFAKDKHPAKKFPWGNIATLGGGNSGEEQEKRDTEIHDKLHDFRKCYYVAESMTLALQSRHDLDTLQQWVVECFSEVPQKTETIVQQPEYPERPFETPEFRKFYKVLPVKDICQVDLTWALPSMIDKYKKKPDKYISWLLGHEGKGSLIQLLRERVWALQLYSGNDESGTDHNSHYMQFGVTIVLTDEGLKNLAEIVKCLFSYLKMLRQKGPQKRIFDEMQKVMETRFRFTLESSAGDNVENLSENMQRYPPSDYIRGSELFFDYDEEEITQCLELLTPQNVNIILFNKNDKEKYQHTEKWFSTPYSVEDINPVELQSWIDVEPLPCFHLPEPNPYIATDFSLLVPESSTKETYPERLSCDERGELWFKQDSKFLLPRAYLYFQLISPLAALSPTNSVLLDLMIALLKQQLHAEVYPAEIAELSYSVYPSIEGVGHGLGIGVCGFNEKLPLLLETILQQLMRFDVDVKEPLFLAIKDKEKKQYYNSFLKPTKLVKNINQSLLKTCYWSLLDRYAAIDDITASQLSEFARQFRSRLFIRALVQGNLSKQQANQVMNIVKDTLGYKPLLPNTWPQLRLGQVEIGSRICRVASFNKESSNSVVAHHFNCGLANIKDCCTAELIMLMLEETVFDTLRTKEQLGYDVSCGDNIIRGILNFAVTVNSQEDKHSLDHVDSRIWAVLEGFLTELSELSERELEELKTSAMRHKLIADLQLKEEVDRNWTEVTTTEYFFHRKHVEHDTFAKITLDDMVSWLKKYVFSLEHRRHLTLQVQGYSQVEKGLQQILKPEEGVEEEKKPSNGKTDGKLCIPKVLQILVPDDKTLKPITDIEEYKSSIYFYPVHKVLQ